MLVLAALLGLGATIAAAYPAVEARATTSIGQLYAYGTNMSGLPVFYGDGIAYIGNAIPSNVSVATNVTFAESSSDSSTWLATPTNSTLAASSSWTTSALYVNQGASAFDSAGFVVPDASSGTDIVTTGFTLFGTLAFWDGDGSYEAAWYATPTDQDGLWILKWNVDNIASEDSTPIAVKNLAPTA